MVQFVVDCFQGPALVASTLVCCVMAYWALVTLGAVDMDSLDVDLSAPIDTPDLSVDVDGGSHSPMSVGMMGLRFFNLGDVPLMVWMTFFSLSVWAITMLFDRGAAGDTASGLQVLARNGGISLFLAKLCTQPLKTLFDTPELNQSQDLLGKTCVVTTVEVTTEHGQASCATGAAPLLVNVRTDDPHYVARKGETVRIVDFEPARNTFIIQRVSQET